MPVEFLTEEQRNCYGRYSGDINSQQLARFFHFSDADHELIYRHRGDHNRLGFAVQLGTVRFLNVFLGNPLDVPPKVTAFVAGQLRIRSLKCFEQYGKRISTQHHHQREIKASYGYRDFHHFSGYFPFFRWLYIRCWLNPERPSTLFDLSLKWLIDSKVLLPGISVMERIVSQIRGRTAEKFWLSLSESQKELIELYGKIRLFVPKLLRLVSFEGTKAGKPIVEALNFLKSLDGKRKSQLTDAPMEAVPKIWKRWVEQEDKVDRKAYTVSIMCQLQDSLRKRDVFVQNSNNWGDTRKKLIQKDDWSSEKKKICRSLGVTDDVDNEIRNLDKLLSDAYGRANLEIEEGRAAFRFEKQNGKEKLVIPNIDKFEVKESNPALTKSRLFWVQQNYLRAETLSRANAKLVEKQSEIPLAQIWGGGEIASADGLRFVVPVRTVNARPNPKYFKNKKGITTMDSHRTNFLGSMEL